MCELVYFKTVYQVYQRIQILRFQCLIGFALLCTLMGIKLAVKRIIGGKWGPCSGQACIGIDYLLVEENLSYSLVFITIRSCYFLLIFVL